MASRFTARVRMLLLQAVGFLIGLVGRAARALGSPKFDSRTTRPVTEPLLLLSGVQLAKLIRQRKVSLQCDLIERKRSGVRRGRGGETSFGCKSLGQFRDHHNDCYGGNIIKFSENQLHPLPRLNRRGAHWG